MAERDRDPHETNETPDDNVPSARSLGHRAEDGETQKPHAREPAQPGALLSQQAADGKPGEDDDERCQDRSRV